MSNIDDDELGRRLLAALMSYHLGYVGVDPLLKKMRHDTIDPQWTVLGRQILRNMVENIDKKPH